MKHALTTIDVHTTSQGFFEITRDITAWVRSAGIEQGLLTVFCRHTSASLTIQENADPDVQHDILTYFKQTVREDPSLYTHLNEGADDMPAHIRTMLTDVSLSIPVQNGQPTLGTWQGVFLFEHRARNHHRQVVLQLMGD
ncbi:secondary thiamine-phosphate synthase enzyme YjbQ [Magnetovibrio sp. PR-2]|uniref:secondary thiamine-phosphate synthase enzyme YjbQ n=1 Tax=Magnetovibrio sp. PR-2 TaxID=3120356 RepID=UPI002FCE24E7